MPVPHPVTLPIPVSEPSPLSLSALLSNALVAFTIEFDNEAEHRVPHRVTRGGGTRGAPWLVSQAMWANVLQYLAEVGDQGLTEGALQERARTRVLLLNGLQRWRWIMCEPEPEQEPRSQPDRGAGVRVRLTTAGWEASGVWRPLAGEIEGRWRSRFGADLVTELREALSAVRDQFDPALALPRYLPVVSPTQGGRAEVPWPVRDAADPGDPGPSEPDLSVLLAQVLLRFTLDFEAASKISLAISANTLRVLTHDGVRIRDLPGLTGVSKEANAMAQGFLARIGCAVEEADPKAARGKIARLTEKGTKAQAKYLRLLGQTEQQWEATFGAQAVRRLGTALAALVGDGSLLWEGMQPYPDGWRAAVRQLATLPQYPMVLHRGGYPDGS